MLDGTERVKVLIEIKRGIVENVWINDDPKYVDLVVIDHDDTERNETPAGKQRVSDAELAKQWLCEVF